MIYILLFYILYMENFQQFDFKKSLLVHLGLDGKIIGKKLANPDDFSISGMGQWESLSIPKTYMNELISNKKAIPYLDGELISLNGIAFVRDMGTKNYHSVIPYDF